MLGFGPGENFCKFEVVTQSKALEGVLYTLFNNPPGHSHAMLAHQGYLGVCMYVCVQGLWMRWRRARRKKSVIDESL